MNLKYVGIVSAIALSAAFAQEPAAAPAVVAPAPVAEAPAAEVPAAEAPAAEAPAAEAADVAVAPKAVRGESAEPAAAPAAAAEVAAPAAAAEVAASAAAETVAEPVVTAPKAVRGESAEPRTVYYEAVYSRPDGVPVRTLYVAPRAQKDTTSLDELMGLVPMQFKIGAFGSIGSYYMSGDKWDGDSYSGVTWRAGITSIVPLNQYTMGVKLGVLFEKSEASDCYNYYDNDDQKTPVNFSFRQMKIDIPVLFTFKASTSNFYFDLGAQASVPLKDKLKVSYKHDDTSIKTRTDMIDEDKRKSVDWSLVFGFSVMANKYLSIDIHGDLGLSDLYNESDSFYSLDLSSSAFTLGVTFYPF